MGKALYLKLRDIYEEHVLNHGGLWNPEAPLEACLAEVEKIVGDAEIADFDFEILKQSKVEKATAVIEKPAAPKAQSV